MSDVFDRLVLGAAAFAGGVAVGLMLAPAEGETTRRRLAEAARQRAEDAQARGLDLAAPVAQRARETAHDLSSRHVPLADDWEVVDGETIRDVARRSGF